MRICPTCQTEYDEDVIRFCTKDGSPLVEQGSPDFSANMPSEGSTPVDDDGERTIIRRKAPADSSATTPLDANAAVPPPKETDSKRIVISTDEPEPKGPGVRPKAAPVKRPPEPKKSNTAVVVLMSIIGTIIVMLGAFGVYWFLSLDSDPDANANLEINENLNGNENFNAEDVNINLNANFEDNSNSNANADDNSNANANASTPSPTPTKTPTPSPSPSPSPTDSNTNSNGASPSVTPTPSATPSRTPTPRPSPPANTNTPVNVGNVNGMATSLPVPTYPSIARDARATGRVAVSVVIDRQGNVVAATAISGHPLLRASAVSAAKRSKFQPVRINGQKVRARGTLNYNFQN